MAIMKRNFTYW